MKMFASLLFALLISSSASAQPITKWTLRVYNVGAASPLTSTDLIGVTCNLPSPPITPGPNPLKAIWDDPVNIGKVCVWIDPGTGPLLSTPFGGSYEATLTATNSAGTSPEQVVRTPFSHPGVAPPVPTGLILGK